MDTVVLESFAVRAETLPASDLLGGAGQTEVAGSQLRAAGTVGDALADLPGVGVASFGPAVGRPVVRGLGEARVQVLAGGLSVADASAAGPDHAVALDPLLIRRATVVRGPASLFYGNRALGGAVDLETRVLPELRAAPGSAGVVLGELAPANGGWAAHGAYEVAGPGWAAAVAGVRRQAGDLAIPGLARRTDVTTGHSHGNAATPEPNPDGTLPNTWLRSDTLAAGARFGGRANLGVGYTLHEAAYGVPFHSHADHTGLPTVEVGGVRLELRQERLEADARWNLTAGPALRLRAAATDYEHREIEGGQTATTFAVRTAEARTEATGQAGAWAWGVGLHALTEEFRSATRDNPFGAYFPAADTAQAAVFGLLRWQDGPWTAGLGARAEHSQLTLTDFAGYELSFDTPSFSLAAALRLTRGWRLEATATRTERAPTTAELFANGGHLSTGLFTRGSVFQFPSAIVATERGWLGEVVLAWTRRRAFARVTVHGADFDRFVFLRRSEFTDDTTGLPIFDYVQRPARLWGVEAEAGTDFDLWGGLLELRGTAETQRGEQKGPDGVARPLPRMPPASVRAAAAWSTARWGAELSATRVFAQNRAELNSETGTPAYMDLAAAVALRLGAGPVRWEFRLSGTNLLDETQRNHLSYLKDVAPLAGRSAVLSLRAEW